MVETTNNQQENEVPAHIQNFRRNFPAFAYEIAASNIFDAVDASKGVDISGVIALYLQGLTEKAYSAGYVKHQEEGGVSLSPEQEESLEKAINEYVEINDDGILWKPGIVDAATSQIGEDAGIEYLTNRIGAFVLHTLKLGGGVRAGFASDSDADAVRGSILADVISRFAQALQQNREEEAVTSGCI